MFSVFLSYKRDADGERATMVRTRLESLGVRVFQDIDMSAGAAVSPILDAQLKSAAAVMVLWTNASIKSNWVTAEAWKGLYREVLVAAVFDRILPRNLQLPFNGVHTPDLSDWIESGALSSHRGWRSVLAALAVLLDRPLVTLADTLEDGGGAAKTNFLQTYPQDSFAEKFACELMLIRSRELKQLIADTQDIINTRAKAAHLKLGDIRARLEGQLQCMVRSGNDFEEFDPRTLADSVLGAPSEEEASGPHTTIPDPDDGKREGTRAVSEVQTPAHDLVLRISFEKRGLDPILLPFSPGPFIEAQLLGARGATLGKGALGAVEANPDDPAVWGVRNKSRLPWRVVAGGRAHELTIGEVEWLVAGDMIDFGGGITGVVEAV
jgi:hypothetical protein